MAKTDEQMIEAPPGGIQPAASGNVATAHTPATEEQQSLAEKAREMKSYRQDDIERRPVVAFHYNVDGTFSPVAAEFPPGVRDVQEAFSYWGFQSAGNVNLGTSWFSTMRLPLASSGTPDYSELLGGARAVGLIHWSDNYESLVILDTEADIPRSQNAFRTMGRGVGGLEASFDPDRNIL